MSADNGIYILVTEGPEYRVCHAQAIENIYWDGEKECPDIVPDNLPRYWGESAIFTDEKKALEAAYKMAKECPILEYGVSIIKFKGKFPGMEVVT